MAGFKPKSPHKTLADIFSKMQTGRREVLLRDLAERDQDAALHIKLLMFTFDDLVRVDERGIQELLRRIAHEDLMVALKGASAALTALFVRNMSARAALLLQEDIAALGPVHQADIDAARTAITDTAMALSDAGSIVISDGGTYVT